MKTIGEKSIDELRDLKFAKVFYQGYATLGFKLSDGQKCKSGDGSRTNWHQFKKKFNPTKKITRVETIVNEYETRI
jgi:hypothetical protein